MDEALIKPQRVRRVVRIEALPPDASGEGDVTAQGTLVEVSDPRALRPRDFRTDFVYRPNSTQEDVALCELPPLLESVLGGTDATLVVGGAAGGVQATLLDGYGGLQSRAVGQLASELQARQARHRSGGSSGYSFYLKLQFFQVVGDRVEDLLTDNPEATKLTDSPGGVVVEGLKGVSISGPEDGARLLEMGRRRQNPGQREKVSSVMLLEVTQADYFAGWGLFGRLSVVELPSLDCLAEDRGLVQLREGFDTYRGVFHLRTLVTSWQPRQPGDANGSVLTWLLRDMLCGGSCAATVLLCLRQQQPAVSKALLEFLDAFAKVETNPVCCDHRVAGLLRSMRAELLLARQPAPSRAADAGDDSRRIILELEKRLQAAERRCDDAVRNEEVKQGRAADFQDRYSGSVQAQQVMLDRLVMSEEEHLRACESLVEAQMEQAEAKEELSELQYKDNILLMVLEQEVADLQTSDKRNRSLVEELEDALRTDAAEREELQARAEEARAEEDSTEVSEARRRARDLQTALDAATEAKIHLEVQREVERDSLENRVQALRNELQRGALDGARERDAELRAANARAEEPALELRALRRAAAGLREELRAESGAGGEAREAAAVASAELLRVREEFQASMARLAAPAPPDAPAGAAAPAPQSAARAELQALAGAGLDRERALQETQRRLEAEVRELQQALAWSSAAALDWAPQAGCDSEKARLRGAMDDARAKAAASATAGAGRDGDLQRRCEELRREHDALQQRSQLQRAEHAQELQRRDVERSRLEAEAMELRRGGGGAMASLQQQLLSEVEQLRSGAAGRGADADVAEENRKLRSRVELLERSMPADQRVQLQRLAHLEKSMRALEAERSELLVRATVAEEQLTQLQRHLKELTEGYQMQIVQLKLRAQPRI